MEHVDIYPHITYGRNRRELLQFYRTLFQEESRRHSTFLTINCILNEG